MAAKVYEITNVTSSEGIAINSPKAICRENGEYRELFPKKCACDEAHRYFEECGDNA